jgi:hypothetical protein
MRQDMQRVIVERPRIGSWRPSEKTGLRLRGAGEYGDDFDSGPRRVSGGRGRHNWWVQKELNENLRPLLRFLRKSVGRSWDKVYSEIRECIDPRKAIGAHVLVHVRQYVDESGRGRRDYGMYVDPRTGILRERK